MQNDFKTITNNSNKAIKLELFSTVHNKLFMSEIIYFWNNVWVETLHRWKNVKIIGIGKTLSSPERSCRKQAFWQTWHYSPIFGNNTSEQLPESNQVRNYKVIWIWVFILIVCTDIDSKNMWASKMTFENMIVFVTLKPSMGWIDISSWCFELI